MLVEYAPEIEVVCKLPACIPVSSKYKRRVSLECAVGGGDDVNLLHLCLCLASGDVNVFLLSFHCGWIIWDVGVGRKLLKCGGNCCESERDAGLLSFSCVVGMLRVDDEPPAKIWVVSDDSSLVSNPGIVVSVKLDPKISFVCLDEFDRDGPSTWSVKVISGVRIVYSVVFKVCVLCDVCWEIVLLSPDDACKLVVEYSVLNGRHDGNSSVFQELVESLTCVKVQGP